MDILILLVTLAAVLAVSAAMVRDSLRHRVAGGLVGATFGVFGLVGLLGALFFLVVPAYRRAQARREGTEPWLVDARWDIWRLGRRRERPPFT